VKRLGGRPPLRAVRVGVTLFFVLYLLTVIWPGGILFAGPEPFILGLPFSFFWPTSLVVLGFGALVLLYWAEEADRGHPPSGGPGTSSGAGGFDGPGGSGGPGVSGSPRPVQELPGE